MSETHGPWTTADGHGDEVLYRVEGALGRARLNRPRAINALDRASVDSLFDQLTRWAEDPGIAAVLLDGAGERGLCAGGDIRAVRTHVVEDDLAGAVAYFSAEYLLDRLVHDYPKPLVAWMDGIVMGGGVGLAGHSPVRLVTERTRIAMPETVIGFFPDVGALWHLSRSPGETGTYAALTGATLTGADALTLGLADHLVPVESRDDVLDLLRQGQAGDEIAGLAQATEPAWLDQHRAWIDACFTGDDPVAIAQRLQDRPEPEAREAAEQIASRSPVAVQVTLLALRRAAGLSVDETFAQDLALAEQVITHPDFSEGVRAQLVDKDRQPRWTHRDLASARAEAERLFSRAVGRG